MTAADPGRDEAPATRTPPKPQPAKAAPRTLASYRNPEARRTMARFLNR